MKAVSGSFGTSAAESLDFARLSLDRNPVHVDSVQARRLQFGSSVVHGVHHMLLALDRAFALLEACPPIRIAQLQAAFPTPVRTGDHVSFELTPAKQPGRIKVVGHSGHRCVLRLWLTYEHDARHRTNDRPSDGASSADDGPVDQQFPATHRAGSLALGYDAELLTRIAPMVARTVPSSQLAAILATTRVVGMRCPGRHSIFSGLKLDFDSAPTPDDSRELRYQVVYEDAGSRLTRVGVDGPGFAGVLDTFFRPPPAEQPTYAEVREAVSDGLFSGQRALVVGGSRGVGETTAKILASGGAQVMLSYSSGVEEASRVQQEILAGGGSCRSIRLDALEPVSDSLGRELAALAATHVYYFASPHIAMNSSKTWDAAAFDRFAAVYVHGFARLVAAIVAARPPDDDVAFYYPSTVYVEEAVKGFAEYATAKTAGEALCRQLGATHPRHRFIIARLPRMATDQTLSVVPLESASTLDVMHEQLLGSSDQRSGA